MSFHPLTSGPRIPYPLRHLLLTNSTNTREGQKAGNAHAQQCCQICKSWITNSGGTVPQHLLLSFSKRLPVVLQLKQTWGQSRLKSVHLCVDHLNLSMRKHSKHLWWRTSKCIQTRKSRECSHTVTKKCSYISALVHKCRVCFVSAVLPRISTRSQSVLCSVVEAWIRWWDDSWLATILNTVVDHSTWI